MTDQPNHEHYDRLLRTVEPTKRSVLLHRLVAAAVTLAVVAGSAWLYVDDPRGWFGESVAEDAAGDASEQPAAATISSVSTTSSVDEEPPADVDEEQPTEANDTLEVEEPTATTRYVDLPTRRLIDTRADSADPPGPLAPGTAFTADLSDVVADSAVAVVLSVNVAAAQGPGLITVSAGGDPVTAIEVVNAGQMTTNLVVAEIGTVPAPGPLTVTTAGGGHVVVDVVGYFEAAASSPGGRFVPVATQRLAQLVTEVDGREAVIRPLDNPALPASGVSSVLVRISADVGSDGGMVRLGEDLEQLPNTMMWAGTSGEDRTRQGVALVPLSELDELAFTYNGGSVLDLDILGYFTDETAVDSADGLFVPAGGVDLLEVDVVAGVPVPVDVAELLGVTAAEIGAVIVNVSGVAEQPASVFISDRADVQPASPTVEFGSAGRRFGVTATAVNADGEIIVTADGDATLEISVPGYFVAAAADG